jgi:hypothetical protein
MQIDLFADFQPVPLAKPPPKLTPESVEDIADRIAAEMLIRCEAIGLNPKALALELKLREVVGFLTVHYSPDEAIGFAVRLIEECQERE